MNRDWVNGKYFLICYETHLTMIMKRIRNIGFTVPDDPIGRSSLVFCLPNFKIKRNLNLSHVLHHLIFFYFFFKTLSKFITNMELLQTELVLSLSGGKETETKS